MSLLKIHSRRPIAPKLAVAIGVLCLLAVPYDVSWSDDTFLFRVETGKPYVYVVFDTSSSMNLSAELGGVMTDANGDDRQSTFHQAKSAVYEVFNDAYENGGDFIHYGLMTYNQNGLRVRGKHWLYQHEGGDVSINGTKYPDKDLAERLVFGAHLPPSATPDPVELPIPVEGMLGSCLTPVDFAAKREYINRFSKLHPLDEADPFDGFVDDMAPTTMWIQDDVGIVYELVVSRKDDLLGKSSLQVVFTLNEWNATCTDIVESQSKDISFKLVQPFLMHDLLGADNAADIVNPAGPIGFAPEGGGGPPEGGGRAPERQDGLWNYQDYTARAVCGDDSHPFTGAGAEMNYDGGIFPVNLDPDDFTNDDPFQLAQGNRSELTLKFPTVLEAAPPICIAEGENELNTLDVGDMLPYHWERTNREEFFSRLAPNWSDGLPFDQLDFGIASYFRDVPNTADVPPGSDDPGFLELVNPDIKPLMAFGDSPVGEALVDWRCFYLGEDQPGGKCRNDEQPFGKGFDWVAPQCDLEWGCRKPFIIVIGDGENNCRGENPAADTANLRRNRVKAWVINFGGPDSRDLRTLAVNTGGEYIEVADRNRLVTVLQNILGEIVEETKAFASAVVPTVQAEEADKVFISNFKPLNQASSWPGTVQAFLKPVPIDGSGRPDTSVDCAADPDTDPASKCFLWNAGEEMLDQVDADISTQFGTLGTQRRVYYSRLSAPGEWPLTRRYLAPTSSGGNSTAERYDLWRGLGLILPNVLDGSLDEATEGTVEGDANDVLIEMMAMKIDDNETPADDSDDSEYILGDIFHSDPLIVGTPINTKFFALNLEDDGTDCADPSSAVPENPSYRCFFRKHQNRRKIVMVGSNDAEVHAIDAGIFRNAGAFAGEFDRGSGKEVFAYTPRAVMPKAKRMYGDGLSRAWTIDGSLTGLDVFIDPVNDSAIFPDPTEREWRTVVIGGLRRGGNAFYALDVTQPDTYNSEGEPTGIVDYVPSCADGGGTCGPIPYPSQLWEFTDSKLYDDPRREVVFDLDQDGLADMGPSWSTPSLGMMKVCTGNNCDPADVDADIENRYVAVFGGGLDKSNSTGNWLYIVDIETGLAIYKRQLLDTDGVTSGGSVASETAAVDSDGDGALDRVYVTTTRGFVYRIELVGPNKEVPVLEDSMDFTLAGGLGLPDMEPVKRIISDDFRPHVIFKAQADAATAGPASRAVYYRPSVIFSAALGQYVLALGTGDRENLWSSDNERGRFYVFKDDIPNGDFATVYTEADLEPIDAELDGDRPDNLLTDPLLLTKGWYMLLRENERLITSPFGVSGVIVFTVFDPDVVVDLDQLTCSRTGRSRVFGVTATNGNGLLFDGGERTRWFDIADFVTEPYVEQSQTKNPDAGGDDSTADDLSADHLAIMEELKKLFPSNCKFANYRLDIKTLSSDTGIHLIAPIPICIVEKNWKEF